MASSTLPDGSDWKNPAFLESWKATRKKRLDEVWRARWAPLFHGPQAAWRDDQLAQQIDQAHELQLREGETLTDRARRLESTHHKAKRKLTGYEVPNLLGVDDAGAWVLSPAATRAKPAKLDKSKRMFRGGLEKKAQRELACGLLGGEVVCRTGHHFRVGYECGNRYCVTCGPRSASRLYAKHRHRLLAVTRRLMYCGDEKCRECGGQVAGGDVGLPPSQETGGQIIPHWPPPRGRRPRIVIAKLDFTLKNTGETGPDLMRWLNSCIKKFCRAIERRWKISRSEYGIAYCDELGANNTNAHAHAIYVGPWLPQEKKELSRMWSKITGDGSFIVSIKYAKSFTAALFHAVKYPAKFAERSTPGRLADLEIIFHRVRRFHTLAAFYNPDVPDEEKPAARKCPTCGDQLSEPKQWRPIYELERMGLRDLDSIELELRRSRALSGPSPPLPDG